MDIKVIDEKYFDEIKAIYEEAGWSAYLKGDEKLLRGIRHTNLILACFDGDVLVGFLRAVGDMEHVVLVQDLTVKKGYRRKGIARELMNELFERYKDVRLIQVNTDKVDEVSNAFYRSIGMKPIDAKAYISYCK